MSCDIADWVQTLTKYLREQLDKIKESYQGSSTQTSFLTAGQTNLVDVDLAMRQWTYCCDLGRNLYEVLKSLLACVVQSVEHHSLWDVCT